MADFTELVDLAAERLGGTVLWATDDFFASKDNLLKLAEPVFLPGEYTDRGKWMDGWESRRKRQYAMVAGGNAGPRPTPAEEDYCLVRLGLPGIVRGVVVDTAHFTGNYPEACSIEGASVAGHPDLGTLLSDAVTWTEILPRSALKGGSKNAFPVACEQRFTHLRFRIYPDGGVARLRVHGDVAPAARWMGRSDRPQLVDLAAAEHGALVVSCNDAYFGSRHNLVMPGRGVNMGDGWETKRGRRPGPDWVVVRLAAEGALERAVIDTLHFKGNAPDFGAIDVARASGDPDGGDDAAWTPLLAKTPLQPHANHVFEDELVHAGPVTHARLRIWPDGGVGRLRLFGIVSPEGRERAGMRYVRAMPEPELRAALLSCCGSRAWVDAMCASRATLSTWEALAERAASVWNALSAADWGEAFRAHPRIGETKGAAAQSREAAAMSMREQAKVSAASEAVRAELAEANRAYEAKFGRTYIVCATGKTAEEMLAVAKARMANDPDTELRRAADEQRQITRLRLEKMVKG